MKYSIGAATANTKTKEMSKNSVWNASEQSPDTKKESKFINGEEHRIIGQHAQVSIFVLIIKGKFDSSPICGW